MVTNRKKVKPNQCAVLMMFVLCPYEEMSPHFRLCMETFFFASCKHNKTPKIDSQKMKQKAVINILRLCRYLHRQTGLYDQMEVNRSINKQPNTSTVTQFVCISIKIPKQTFWLWCVNSAQLIIVAAHSCWLPTLQLCYKYFVIFQRVIKNE